MRAVCECECGYGRLHKRFFFAILQSMKWKIPEGKELRIAISGKSGCGNTTVSKLLAEKLDIAVINFTFRSLSEETGLSLAEIIERAKNDDGFDKAVDTRQLELARKESCVLGSRLAIWMLKEADFKVYLRAGEDVRARRICKRECGDIEKVKAFTRMRDAEDSGRYKKLYNIDNNDFSFADLIIDTEQYNPEQIVDMSLEALGKKGLIVRER